LIILGINEDHNGSAAIIKDGKVLACASEERFTRVKNDTEYPYHAINSVLETSRLGNADIDYVVFAGKHFDALQMKIKRVTRFSISDYIREQKQYWKKILIEGGTSDFWDAIAREERFSNMEGNYYDYSFMENQPKSKWDDFAGMIRCDAVKKHLGKDKHKVRFLDHHKGHAYYAYFASPHDISKKAAIVTADGWGDGCNATISVAENGVIKEIHRTKMCNMARMYRWATLLLGMKPNEHEFKVMGLAPYAKDYICEPAYKIYKETLVVDGLDFKWNKKPSDMYFYFKDKLDGIRFDGIAAGIQLWLEDLLSEWITNIMKYTNTRELYYSGGLSMNVKANKVISDLPLIEKLYVSPSGGDESLAMGCGFAISSEMGCKPVPLHDAYLGYEVSKTETIEATEQLRNKSNYSIIENPNDEMISELLVQGMVLGRCVGRMEFGARSLGNRAILCDPSKYENIRIINEKIKFRDFWMPFTPSILAERADDYLVNPKGIDAYYMTIAFDSTPLAREHIKAAIHPYDFTVRPQLVSPEINQDYHSLIKAFEKRSGIGALLNTSLNLHGQPIVCTAEDAIDTFVNSGLDGMILSGTLILKK